MNGPATAAPSSADIALLRDSARHFLSDRHPIRRLRADIDGHHGVDRALWRAAATLGWQGLLVPEAQGGGGGSWTDALVIAEECGRALYPYPLADTMVLGSLLAGGPIDGTRTQLLSRLVDGTALVAWGIAESEAGWQPQRTTTRVSRIAGDRVVTGQKWFVPAADDEAEVVVIAATGDRLALVAVDRGAAGMTAAPSRTIDPTRSLCRVTLNDAAVDERQVLDVDPSALQRAVDGLTLLIAADAAGACARLVSMTVEYAMQREAFGRRIAEYQAIKHRCADMAVWTETIAAAARGAAAALDADEGEAARRVSAAKLLASDLGPRVAGEALQVHGGIGFTWEHDVHLYLRRVVADSILFGDAAFHGDRLVAALSADLSA